MTDTPSTAPPPITALQVAGLTKVYGAGTTAVTALDAVDLTVPAGTFTAVMGPSGSGKSTLLHCMAGLDRPTAGTVTVDGHGFTGLSPAALTRLRRTRIGLVFQDYNLLPTLSVLANVTLPMRLAGTRIDRDECRALLDAVGLAGLADRRPGALSGGQQQRVAIARALASRPEVVIADEPTGALDSAAAAGVLDLLRAAVDEYGQTVVMVTHDPVAAARADTVVFLADGRIAGALPVPTAAAVAARMIALEPALSAGDCGGRR